jgi:hypothetical protein
MPPKPEWDPPKDIKAMFGWSSSTLYRMLGNGVLEAKKDGKSILSSVASCERYIVALPPAKVKQDKYRSRELRASTNEEAAR